MEEEEEVEVATICESTVLNLFFILPMAALLHGIAVGRFYMGIPGDAYMQWVLSGIQEQPGFVRSVLIAL